MGCRRTPCTRQHHEVTCDRCRFFPNACLLIDLIRSDRPFGNYTHVDDKKNRKSTRPNTPSLPCIRALLTLLFYSNENRVVAGTLLFLLLFTSVADQRLRFETNQSKTIRAVRLLVPTECLFRHIRYVIAYFAYSKNISG